MKKEKANWETIDRIFIRENFFSMTWTELLTGINEIRSESDKVRLGQLRHECRRMGLFKMRIIHWEKSDVKFLKDNFKTKGNIEIAEILSGRKKSKRKIDGELVIREFTKKNIEKKIKLLGLKRSADDLATIRKRNKEIGRGWTISKDDNLYTRGLVSVRPEGETVIWNHGKQKLRFIKIDGKHIPYSRWYYRSFVGDIPPGFIVYHKDFDSLNDDQENLAICNRQRLRSSELYSIALELLKNRETLIQNQLQNIPDSDKITIKQTHSELNRVRRIMSEINAKIKKNNYKIKC